MADAFTRTAGQMIEDVRFELRDIYDKQYPDDELLQYLNNCCEMVYNLLVDAGSELIRTGNGTIFTETGIYEYPFTEHDMGDLWVPCRVWIAGETVLEMCEEKEQLEYEWGDGSMMEGLPEKYFIEGGSLFLLPAPNAVLDVSVKYYPNFTELPDLNAVVPFRGLFNLQLREGLKIFAKNRESLSLGIEASLMQIFQDRALAIANRRRKKDFQMIPRFS